MRARVKDKRVVALVKAFLKAGIMTELGAFEDTHTGTPQGGILTPPTQWAIPSWVTLRVGVAGLVGAFPDRNVVADRDVLGSDEDVWAAQLIPDIRL